MIYKPREDRVVVEFIVGGSAHCYTVASDADVIVLADSLDETSRVPDRPNLLKVSLGDHDTVLSLLERVLAKCPEAKSVYEEYQKKPSVYLSAGMAQDPRLGRYAILDYIHQGKMTPVFKEVYRRLLEACNGSLLLIVVREINSNAGGMGSAGGPEIGAAFIRDVEKRTNAKLWHHMIRVGGLTYTYVAPGAIINTAKATRHNLDWILQSSEANKTKDMDLVELSLRNELGECIRGNREMRNHLAATFLAARLCPGVMDEVNSIKVNFKTNSRLGDVYRIRASWSDSLDKETLTKAAAVRYRDIIRNYRMSPDQPNMEIAAGVDCVLTPLDPELPTADELIALAKANRHDPVLGEVSDKPLRKFETVCLVCSTEGSGESLEQIVGRAERPATFSEAREQLKNYRGVLVHLENAVGEAERDNTRARIRFERSKKMFKRKIRSLGSYRYNIEKAVFSRRQVDLRWRRIFQAYLDAHKVHSETSARLGAFTAAAVKVRLDIEHYQEQWARRVEKGLDLFIDDRPIYVDTAEFESLDEVYADVVDVILRVGIGEKPEKDRMERSLIRSVTRITMKGIAKMLDVDPDPHEIVAALEKGKYLWRSPLWGGEFATDGPRHQFVVFPPIADSDLEDLRKAAESRRFNAQFKKVSTVAGGCAVVELYFYPVTRSEEVIPPAYTDPEETKTALPISA